MTQKNLVDLHLHSTCSDGSDSPTALFKKAYESGCRYVALTDHDTTSGLVDALEFAASNDLTALCGVELSIPDPLGTFHLLLYIPVDAIQLVEDTLSQLRASRITRNQALIAEMRADGIPITMELVEGHTSGKNLGRPHFAATLVELSVARDIQDAFDRFLGKGAKYYIPKDGLSLQGAVELARAAGGVTSWAHPLTLVSELSKISDRLSAFKEVGLDAIEAHYSRYRPEVREYLAELAGNLGLLTTGGSDYHGTFKVGLTPGIGEGDLAVPRSVFEALAQRLG